MFDYCVGTIVNGWGMQFVMYSVESKILYKVYDVLAIYIEHRVQGAPALHVHPQ